MSISVQCPCGKRFRAPDSLAGKRAKCGSCGMLLDVPDAQENQTTPAKAERKPFFSRLRDSLFGTPEQRAKRVEEYARRREEAARKREETKSNVCFKCGLSLVEMGGAGKITFGTPETLKRTKLRCNQCGVSFCEECGGRRDYKVTCPRCGGFSDPPMFVV